MKKILGILTLLVAILLPTSCATAPSLDTPVVLGTNSLVVTFVIEGNGVSEDYENITISNFHRGSRAEVIFRILNSSEKEVTPQIYPVMDYDVTKYSKAEGAINAPGYVSSWLEIPEVTSIQPGETKDFIVALVMPNDADRIADKIGFAVGVTPKPRAQVQSSVSIWWLVNMR